MKRAVITLLGLFVATHAPNIAWSQGSAAPAKQVSFMIFGDPAEKATYDVLVAAFAKKNSQVAVNLIHMPGQGALVKRLAADVAAGTPPDIFLIDYRRHGLFAARGALEPVGPYLAKSAVIKESDFFQQALDPYYKDGTLMCLPQNLSSLVVYYNKKLFDGAGLAYPSADWTWDDFVKTAKALTREVNGEKVFGLGSDISVPRLSPFIWQNGGSIVDDSRYPTRLTIASPEAMAAVQWFADLQTKHQVMPDAVQEKAESSQNRFLNGRLGMYLNSRRGVPTYRTIKTFEWDVAPLPRGKQQAGILHSDGFCMTAKGGNKDAAWSFIEFAMSAEGQTILAETGRTVPSLKSVANSRAFLNPDVSPKNSRVFLDVIPTIRSLPAAPNWPDIEDTVGKEFERAVYGQAPVDQAIASAIERASKNFND